MAVGDRGGLGVRAASSSCRNASARSISPWASLRKIRGISARIGCSGPTTSSKTPIRSFSVQYVSSSMVPVMYRLEIRTTGAVLADAVDAADPLLHPHGVPRQVVVDQGRELLEVQALRGGVGAEQDVDCLRVALLAAGLDLGLLHRRQALSAASQTSPPRPE